uniref:SAGA-associated factor 11 n=1 Tax=Aureoumbra lagunensis TaxID=44058 RepID=A0A7S3NI93_9STRA
MTQFSSSKLDSLQEEIEMLICSKIIESSVLDLVFEILHRLRRSLNPNDELCSPPLGSVTHFEEDTCSESSVLPQHNLKSNPILHERLLALSETRTEVRCAHCGQKVSAQRFAPHLDKCMGKGYVLFSDGTKLP